MPGVLALDVATVTGWALSRPGAKPAPTPVEIVAGATIDAHLSGNKVTCRKGGEDVRAWRTYHDWLKDMLALHNPDWVVYEAPFISGNSKQANAAFRLLGFASLTETLCDIAGIQCRKVNNGSVRKHFIGRGTGNRKDLKLTTERRCRDLGWTFRDDNEADALACLDFALMSLGDHAPKPIPGIETSYAEPVVEW